MNKTKRLYQFTCTVNGKVYVGASINCEARRSQHLGLLRRQRHWNPQLQADYNTHRPDAFTFTIIHQLPDSATRNEMFIKEAELTLRIPPELRYNIRIGAANTPAQRELIRQGWDRFKQSNQYDEWCEHRSEIAYGRHHSLESKMRISQVKTGSKYRPRQK